MTSFVTDSTIDSLTDSSVLLTQQLIELAESYRTRSERANRKRFARMVTHPSASKLTMILTDRVIRIDENRNAAKSLKSVAQLATVSGVGFIDFVLLNLATFTAKILPNFVMRAVRWRVRTAAHGIILPAERNNLKTHLQNRSAEKAALNVNILGEAILGEHEASLRLKSLLAMMERAEVNYVSVKISALVSQINALDHSGSISRVALPLREIYRSAIRNSTFVNLDMEEFKDLKITVDVFMKLLDETEFENMSAGIVLQAYLPDSHEELERLIIWANNRHLRTGAHIKIRIVKGANLAQEVTDAQLHGWPVATYPSKAEVDGSYLRMLDLLLRPEHATAVRAGVASHNLFHLAWAISVARSRGVVAQVDIEMLEGMANAEALAIAESFGSVLLYAPVAYASDFPSAVAYLVRRLDENTSPENYLSASFTMTVSGLGYQSQLAKFTTAVAARHQVQTHSARHSVALEHDAQVFSNASDGDPTDPGFQSSVAQELQKITQRSEFHIPLGMYVSASEPAATELGQDPNAEGSSWYTFSVANRTDVDQTIADANAALSAWEELGADERGRILRGAAQILASRRTELIALMARDGGKPALEADAEVSEAIDFANYYAAEALKLPTGAKPVGTVLIVPPWNFPLAIPLGGVCSALAVGNTVVLKPAPETVATAYEIAQVLWQAGVPKNVLQFLPSRDDEVGRHLVTHPGIATVILTGSFDTALMFKEWKPELNLLAETSGKNSIVITPSADIDSAVKDLVASAFGHAGQKCSAASLAIVHASIYESESFRSQLVDAARSLAFGPSTNIDITNGPLIRPPSGSLQRALTQLEPGESWLLEPRQMDQAGYLWTAGIKLGIAPNSWSHVNEWFGPVLGLMKAQNLNEALRWQNATPYGLTAGIASLDEEECNQWAAQVEAGNLYVNRGVTGAVVSRQPFGGWKQSSVGPTAKAGGPHYLEQLCKWNPLGDTARFIKVADHWLKTVGVTAVQTSDLTAELNYFRYRPYKDGILVVVDKHTKEHTIEVLQWIQGLRELNIRMLVLNEDEDLLTQIGTHARGMGKVRWLSNEVCPEVALMKFGVSIDKRDIADEATVELPRWLREQSISVTNHRYGNVGAAPHVAIV